MLGSNYLKVKSDRYSQVVKFLVAGIISNGVGYGLFLFAIHSLSIEHKTAATLLFVVGMAVNFTINKNWTFGVKGHGRTTLLKFISIYLCGYALNILILSTFVDHLGYQAGLVQLAAIGFLVVYYYIANKFFIFRLADE